MEEDLLLSLTECSPRHERAHKASRLRCPARKACRGRCSTCQSHVFSSHNKPMHTLLWPVGCLVRATHRLLCEMTYTVLWICSETTGAGTFQKQRGLVPRCPCMTAHICRASARGRIWRWSSSGLAAKTLCIESGRRCTFAGIIDGPCTREIAQQQRMSANSLGQENCEPRACVKRTLSIREERGCNLSCLIVWLPALPAQAAARLILSCSYFLGVLSNPTALHHATQHGMPAGIYLYRRAAQALSCVIRRLR